MSQGISKTFALVLVAGLIVLSAVIGIGFVMQPGSANNRTVTTLCQSCFVEEPVVDVILPTLTRNPGGSVSTTNAPLNMTRGSTQSLSVDVYPTVSISVTLVFRVLLSPSAGTAGSSASLSASFSPSELSISSQGRGVSTLTISVPANALPGTYNAAVSVEQTNATSSGVWGTFFMINVA